MALTEAAERIRDFPVDSRRLPAQDLFPDTGRQTLRGKPAGEQDCMKSRQSLVKQFLSLTVLMSGSAFGADGGQCTNIADSAARLACYDAALKPHANAAGASVSKPATTSTKPVKPAAESAVVAQADFGMTPQLEHRAAPLKRLHATVIALQQVPVGQVMTLDNGQVWQISDYLPQPFVQLHDAVVINRGLVGSFLMVRASGGDSVHVKRLK